MKGSGRKLAERREQRRLRRKPKSATGHRPGFARATLLLLVEERGAICGICHKPLGNLALCNIDHKIPLSKGGTDAWSNLQPAHISCNNAKADRVV